MYPGFPTHIIEERQDIIFRKVRGILNKITPETFDKLSRELVNVGLDSPRTLRGVIYLLFDKALKDLKYTSLYAKLCQILSERVPNFEQEPGPNTFCKFLISKCEDEFERRRKATEDFDGKNELTDEEFELKAIAKLKMLGNIKFICELGKKRLLQEGILHECIRGLLSKKKERPIQEQAQDLECLCQIMKTVGSLLDIQASRNLMNQYFDRIDMFSKKSELPSRIRFMLRDVIDLRKNNWRPRPFQREDNVPQPLSKLRAEASFDFKLSSTVEKIGGNNKNLFDLSRLHGGNLSSLIADDGPSYTTSVDIHWDPTAFTLEDRTFDFFCNARIVNATKKIENYKLGDIDFSVVNNQALNDRPQRQGNSARGPIEGAQLSSEHERRKASVDVTPQVNQDVNAPPQLPFHTHRSHRHSKFSGSQDYKQAPPASRGGQPYARFSQKEPPRRFGALQERQLHRPESELNMNWRNRLPSSSSPNPKNPIASTADKLIASTVDQPQVKPQSKTHPKTPVISQTQPPPPPPPPSLQSQPKLQSTQSQMQLQPQLQPQSKVHPKTQPILQPSHALPLKQKPLPLSQPPLPLQIPLRSQLQPQSNTHLKLQPMHLLQSQPLQTLQPQPKPQPAQPSQSLTQLQQQTPSHSQLNLQLQPQSQQQPQTQLDPSRNATRDIHVKQFMSSLLDNDGDVQVSTTKIVQRIKDLRIPRSYQQDCLVSAMKHSITGTETERSLVKKLFVLLIPSFFEPVSLTNAFRTIFDQLKVLEVETPKVKSLVAGFVSQAVFDNLVSLEELGTILAGGKHHPLFLLILQKLEREAGQAWVSEKFIASRINMMDMLSKVDRTKERLASALKDRCLGFLYPMLTVEPELWQQMRDCDSGPTAIYRWIKDNVDQSIQNSPTFAHVLMSCLLKYIHNAAIEKSKALNGGQYQQSQDDNQYSEKSTPTNSSGCSNGNNINEIEKEMLTKYQQVLQAFLKDKPLQLIALYSLQSFYFSLNFPKGSLLRWFHMLYELNIIDEDVYFKWKEEINDEFPGKGQALFQVNTWFNWLATSETDDEDNE